VAGIAVVLRPLLEALLSRSALLVILGASAITTGVLRLLGTFHDDQLAREHPRHRYRFVIGALEVLLGITLLVAGEGASPRSASPSPSGACRPGRFSCSMASCCAG